MRTDFLIDLASLEHFPADFDPTFFNEIAERFVLSGKRYQFIQLITLDNLDSSFEIQSLLEFVNANAQLKQPTVLWSVVLAVLKRLEDKRIVVELYNDEWRRWLDLASECSCMQKIFYELTTQLMDKKLLSKDVVQGL
jgi:hypothetical protein